MNAVAPGVVFEEWIIRDPPAVICVRRQLNRSEKGRLVKESYQKIVPALAMLGLWMCYDQV
jgi:hypothetical protein